MKLGLAICAIVAVILVAGAATAQESTRDGVTVSGALDTNGFLTLTGQNDNDYGVKVLVHVVLHRRARPSIGVDEASYANDVNMWVQPHKMGQMPTPYIGDDITEVRILGVERTD